jgi:hypothetical protein
LSNYQQEWGILHADIEKYERYSLLIKLTAVLSSVLCEAFSVALWFTISVILLLWLQEGIWKTFQGRLGIRIEYVEHGMKNKAKEDESFQLYTQWQTQRPGIKGLVREYVVSSLKPTVAFLYIALVILVGVF